MNSLLEFDHEVFTTSLFRSILLQSPPMMPPFKSDTDKLGHVAKRVLVRVVPVALLFYVMPSAVTLWFAFLLYCFLYCGLWDVSRNGQLGQFGWRLANRYFLGNGAFTWLLSPFNIVLDFLCHKNTYVYSLQDLPPEYAEELDSVIKHFKTEVNLDALEEKLADNRRGMLFFKWFGKNIDSSLRVSQFHQPFRYVKTIGVSVFNKKQSTGLHFGPLRITFRLLYNITPAENDNVYIEVGRQRNVWWRNPLFIFDDTLLHQSVNESSQVRYCLYVDFLRPSRIPGFLSLLLRTIQIFMLKINGVFYKKWAIMK